MPRPRRPRGEATHVGGVGRRRCAATATSATRRRRRDPRRRRPTVARRPSTTSGTRCRRHTPAVVGASARGYSLIIGPAMTHRLEPAAGLADPARALEPGERHRRLGDRQPERRRRRRRACADRPGTRRARSASTPRGSGPRVERRSARPAGCRARARRARRRRRVTGAAPSRSSWFVPAAARLRGEPGTAITSTERSIAAWAVISEPPRSRLSTTTRTSLSAARMRLRSGNRNGSGAVPGGHSDSSRPRSRDLGPQLGVLLAGTARRARCRRPPTGARPAPPRSAPRWAAPSMPLASPDTTATPASASSRPSAAAMSRPGLRGVAGADDADPPSVERAEVAADEQHRRRLRVERAAAPGSSGRRAVTATMPERRAALAPLAGDRSAPLDARHAAQRRRSSRRATRRRAGAPAGGDGERLVGLVVGEQRPQAGDASSVEAGERGQRSRRRAVGRAPSRHQSAIAAREPRRASTARARRGRRRRSRRRSARRASRSAIVRATRRTRW